MAKVGTLLSSKSLSTVLLLFFLLGACSRGAPPPGAGAPPGIPVKLQQVETSTVEDRLDLGDSKLEANKRVDLRPEADGRVVQIFVSSGTRVAAGTPIVQLRPEKGQAEVGGAIADVNAARASLNNAQAQLKAVEAERVSAAANLELQNKQYRRISSLVSQGALAKQQLDEVISDRDAARAALNANDERIRAARATLDQTNASLSSAQANAAVKSEDLKESRVLAPIAGVVGDITVKLGDYVKAGDTLTTIIENQSLNLSLSFDAEDDRASQLRVGLAVQLLVGAKDDEILATGRISFISPQVKSDQRILAKANFPNPEGSLRDGQIVNSRVIWNRRPGVLIPTIVVSKVAGQDFVYVAQQEQSKLVARQKPVKLGKTTGNNSQVLEGLKAGEKIIVSGIQNLSDGAPIIPQP